MKIYRGYLFIVLLSFLVVFGARTAWADPSGQAKCPDFGNNPTDGPPAWHALRVSLRDALLTGNFDAIEKAASDWNNPDCATDDGMPLMNNFLSGIAQAFYEDENWGANLDRLTTFRQVYPKSAAAALAEADYWILYGWDARGGGYANSVTEDGWKLFRERFEKAETILNETKSYSSTLPNWYTLMIQIQGSLGLPEIDSTFLEGVTRFPKYKTIYLERLEYLEPKWGGSNETVDKFILWSVEYTKAQFGQEMYAHLYWEYNGNLREGQKLFKDTLVNWPKMKKGFDDLVRNNPKSTFDLLNYAYFACQAGDKKVFLSVRKRAEKAYGKPLPADDAREVCEIKYGYHRKE